MEYLWEFKPKSYFVKVEADVERFMMKSPASKLTDFQEDSTFMNDEDKLEAGESHLKWFRSGLQTSNKTIFVGNFLFDFPKNENTLNSLEIWALKSNRRWEVFNFLTNA